MKIRGKSGQNCDATHTPRHHIQNIFRYFRSVVWLRDANCYVPEIGMKFKKYKTFKSREEDTERDSGSVSL